MAGCGGRSPSDDLPAPQRAEMERMHALFTAPLAGQTVPVLPLTLVVADVPSRQGPLAGDHAAVVAWGDSLVGYALTARAPEVNWMLPEELRQKAKRAPTLVTDPDKMGQSILRNERIDVLPDPLRTYSRNLVAVTGGRLIMVPAALEISQSGDQGTRAELTMVLADVRLAKVMWRTRATGYGADAALALDSAMATMLPLSQTLP